MKKYISYLTVIALLLFVGIRVSSATAIAEYVTLGKYDCSQQKVVGDKKYTTCVVSGVAKETTTLSGSETWSVEYNDNTLNNTFKVDSSSGLGLEEDVKTTSTGGSFTFNYSGNITKGQNVTLFNVEFITDNVADKDCGGVIAPDGQPGNSKSNNSDQTVDDEPTGVSIPAAIIGLGAITGLAIYSVASSKTKMHRI